MYKLVLKKGKIELELATTDKEIVARHIALIVNQANNRGNNIPPKLENKEEITQNNFNPQPQIETKPEVEENIIPNLEQKVEEVPIPQVDNVVENNEEIHTESEFKPEQNIVEQEQQIEPQHFEEQYTPKQEIMSTSVVSFKPNTINAIQNPIPEEKPNFDEIYNNKIEDFSDSNNVVLKDSKFIEFVESKSAIEKLDYLVITAQYLAQFENVNTFNLKHINAKLMQNFTIIVDHSVLQSAMSKEYITKLPNNVDDINGEYILTEKGLRSY